MAIRKPVLAGNWKMHKGPAETREFFAAFLELHAERADSSLVFFPPSVSLAAALESLRDRTDIALGVQNVYWEPSGAFTGEVSAPLAAAAGARFALVGHSERRHVFGETIEDTRRKALAVLAADLALVLCVGERLEERRAGRAEAVVAEQLEGVLPSIGEHQLASLLVAYEPVWAIGTGETASPEDAAQMHRAIRQYLRQRFGDSEADTIPILYGGSVKPDNVRHLLAADQVDGVLVGGASLDPAGFSRICTPPY